MSASVAAGVAISSDDQRNLQARNFPFDSLLKTAAQTPKTLQNVCVLITRVYPW